MPWVPVGLIFSARQAYFTLYYMVSAFSNRVHVHDGLNYRHYNNIDQNYNETYPHATALELLSHCKLLSFVT